MTRLEQLRMDAHLSIEQLASAAQVSPKTIRRLEVERRPGQITKMARLAAHFDVPVSELLQPAISYRDRQPA